MAESSHPHPLQPSVRDKLHPKFAEFYDEKIAPFPMIHEKPFDPEWRFGPPGPETAPDLPVGRIEDVQLPNFKIRIYYPPPPHDSPPPVLVYYHGGGMAMGNISSESSFCTRVCSTTKCVVVFPDYRLAPENTFPAGHDDAWEALQWTLAHGKEYGWDTTRLGVGGSSSGGNLALYASQRAGAEGIKVDFVVVGVPVCDNTVTWKSRLDAPGLIPAKMEWYRDLYLPNKEDRRNPDNSPLLASDEVFASTPAYQYFALAEHDILREEGEAYAARVKADGKEVEVVVHDGMPHAMQVYDGLCDTAREVVWGMCRAVAKGFGLPKSGITMPDLYPEGELDIPQIQGGGPWLKYSPPMTLGEGIMFRKSDSTLHYFDCLATPPNLQILSVGEGGSEAGCNAKPAIFPLRESVTVAAFRADHPGYICAYEGGVAFLSETGELEIIKEIVPPTERNQRRMNDGAVDCAGRFWFVEIDRVALYRHMQGGSLIELGTGKGRVWRYDPDGTLTAMDEGLTCGNGVAWNPDNTVLYIHDSPQHIVYAYDFEASSGNISNKRIHIDRRVLGGEPDGLVVDTEGNLWIAMWNSHRLMCFSPSGKHLKDVIFPSKRIACPAWGGSGMDELYVVSALDDTPWAKSGDLGGQLYRYIPGGGIKGLEQYRFGG